MRNTEQSWWDRPEDVLGAPVCVCLLLGLSPQAAVQVTHVTVFPNGFEFRVICAALAANKMDDPMFGLIGPQRTRESVDAEDANLRIDILYADGRTASTWRLPNLRQHEPPSASTLYFRATNANAQVGRTRSAWFAEATFWVAPLPEDGGISFACQWPQFGIHNGEGKLSSEMLREELVNIVRLWPDTRE